METVIIFGAGASVSAGAPDMANFLDRASRVSRQDPGTYDEEFNLVFRAYHRLERVFAKSTIDLDNIEALYGALEMWSLLDVDLDAIDATPDRLTRAIRRVIVRTLEVAVTMDPDSDGHQARPPGDYASLAAILQEVQTPTTLITFNYDVCLDVALETHGIPIDYVVAEVQPQTSSRRPLKLLKLHGSLNWTQDAQSRVHVRAASAFYQRKRKRFEFLAGRQEGTEPFIVPPTWSKASHHKRIASVWATAARCLARAERIIVIGYSLPRTDEFFRYLFALGTLGDTRLTDILFINPDRAAYDRFADMLGGLSRRRLEPFGEKYLRFNGQTIQSTIRPRLLAP